VLYLLALSWILVYIVWHSFLLHLVVHVSYCSDMLLIAFFQILLKKEKRL